MFVRQKASAKRAKKKDSITTQAKDKKGDVSSLEGLYYMY